MHQKPLPTRGAFFIAGQCEPIESTPQTCYCWGMTDNVRRHYELYPYPHYPLLASVRRCDTYALNLEALWARFNGRLPPRAARRILIAGCGSFAPYPFSVANPDGNITALDLSRPSIRRARLHCLLHGRRNVTFRTGDLLDPAAIAGQFGLIDAYGVLHHLQDPLAGLKVLAERLVEGGILRIMVYSRYARRQEESIRRAFRLLKVTDTTMAKRLIVRARPGSRLHGYAKASSETAFNAGLADALLHPSVHTYRIDDLMDVVRQSGLEPLLFAHDSARQDVGQELERIRRMEAEQRSPGNFILYLGRNVAGPCPSGSGSLVTLNPCLRGSLGGIRFGSLEIAPRLGHAIPPLDRRQRRFLRRFTRPLPWEQTPGDSADLLAVCIKALFLLQYRP